jgi:GNAT superfamily N-acetyltransferase
MKKSLRSTLRKLFHQTTRRLFGFLPRPARFAVFRAMVDCDPAPDKRLELKIADTKEELEACFRILHDAYVSSGFMKPDPSGMRVTMYHALPTTTTLCAKFDGVVVGTISIIREGVFGFPLQSIFDLSGVRAKEGNIAEISALAVHPSFRKTGGSILFPLMKFMYEYCTEFFDTRHLVIAVNPNKIELYESLLFFDRLQETTVNNYDFANGAPAVGATLDLHQAPELFNRAYGRRRDRKNLFKYFVETRLPNIRKPIRRYFTTNDPVMSVDVLDHFFNQVHSGFESLDARKKLLLKSIYNLPDYRRVLPEIPDELDVQHPLRQHQRYSIKCPGHIVFTNGDQVQDFNLTVIEVSLSGFQAECRFDLPHHVYGDVIVDLGENERSVVRAAVIRHTKTEFSTFYGFHIEDVDHVWNDCVSALEQGQIHSDLGAFDSAPSSNYASMSA